MNYSVHQPPLEKKKPKQTILKYIYLKNLGIIISNSNTSPNTKPKYGNSQDNIIPWMLHGYFFFSNHYDILFKLNPILIAILFDYPHDYDHSSFTFSFSHQISFTTQPCATKISPIGPTIGCIFHYSFHSNGDYL